MLDTGYDDIEFINFAFSDEEMDLLPNISKERFSNIKAKCRKNAKPKKCECCHSITQSFCKSHFVPAFCLKAIAEQGKIALMNSISRVPVIDEFAGVNNSGTFSLICRKCDNALFSTYENPENYGDNINSKIMAEITVKNYLKYIYKRRYEQTLWQLVEERWGTHNFLNSEAQLQGVELDILEYRNSLKRAISTLKDNDNAYRLIYYKKLPYTCPIAFQAPVALIFDMEGEIINDIYSLSSHKDIMELQLAVLPTKQYTAVLLFVESKIKRYKNFIKQFNQIRDEEKLVLINYIIFLYNEDYFLTPSVAETLRANTMIRKVVGQSTMAGKDILSNARPILAAREHFDLRQYRKIPNILSQNYRI